MFQVEHFVLPILCVCLHTYNSLFAQIQKELQDSGPLPPVLDTGVIWARWPRSRRLIRGCRRCSRTPGHGLPIPAQSLLCPNCPP